MNKIIVEDNVLKPTISQVFDSPDLSENEKFQAIANQENVQNYSLTCIVDLTNSQNDDVDYVMDMGKTDQGSIKRPRLTKCVKPSENASKEG